jgi:predicted GIY-YIG superfamily endonuclease
MPYGVVYRISFPNGKNYVGITRNKEKRTREHRCSAKNGGTKCLYKALRKYGMVDTFNLDEIDTADNEEELREKEIEWIKKYNSHYIDGNGYNMTYGGEGTCGYIHTEQDKQRARESQINYFEKNFEAKELHVARLCRRWKENPVEAGKEHGEKMKKYYDINTDAGIEARERARNKTNEQFAQPGARERMSEALKIRFKRPGEIEKISEAAKKRFEKPGEIEKISEAAKKRHSLPGAKEKLLDQRGKNRPFDVFKDGIFIGTFTYQFKAKEYLQNEYNITKNIDVSSVLNGTTKTSSGFVFKYKL